MPGSGGKIFSDHPQTGQKRGKIAEAAGYRAGPGVSRKQQTNDAGPGKSPAQTTGGKGKTQRQTTP